MLVPTCGFIWIIVNSLWDNGVSSSCILLWNKAKTEMPKSHGLWPDVGQLAVAYLFSSVEIL